MLCKNCLVCQEFLVGVFEEVMSKDDWGYNKEAKQSRDEMQQISNVRNLFKSHDTGNIILQYVIYPSWLMNN